LATRQELADLWRDGAQITRQDIFGLADALRPVYSTVQAEMTDQIDVPAVGMVGLQYRGELALLSVNGAGGRDNPPNSDSSNRM
jgi:hypothetical protein